MFLGNHFICLYSLHSWIDFINKCTKKLSISCRFDFVGMILKLHKLQTILKVSIEDGQRYELCWRFEKRWNGHVYINFLPSTTTTLNNMFMQDHTHVILLLIKKKTLFVLSIWVGDILHSKWYEVVLILERVIDVIAYH